MAARAEPQRYRPDWMAGRVTSWLTTVDHKRIGILYIGTSLLFFVAGGVMALLMRTQLITPDSEFLTRDAYNQVVTMHGTTMVFLVVVPVWAGIANFLVPLMIGARDMAFPRLNALSYWLFLFGGIVLMGSFFAEGGAARSGWYGYPPLSIQATGHGQDYWILGLHILSAASLVGAINFIVTIHNMRTAGMTWMRLPLFVWTIEVYAWLLVAVLPTLSAGLTLLLLDRQFGTSFFLPAGGGEPLLYQHAFWFFGHPEVYIMILPAFGVISEVLPVFCRKPIFGYKAIAFSTVAIGFFSLLVWAHHMFAVGLPTWLNGFFMVSSVLIGVPTGIKIFNWVATMFRGQLTFPTPMLFATGFIYLFTLGGITGVIVASPPLDFHLHDTYYVVAHFHNVLVGGSVFALFAGIYFWFPKMTGRRLSERLGKLHFWSWLVGFILTFLPQYQLGAQGMPRRYADYAADAGWTGLNIASTAGAFLMGVGILPFLAAVVLALRRRPDQPADPWGANSLEWWTTSPPPHHNFTSLPAIRSERPVFDARHAEAVEADRQ
jgi:cytochrome c oxidase subunit 1